MTDAISNSLIQAYGPQTKAGAGQKAQPTGADAELYAKADAAAKDFESMFMSQMMQFMWTDTNADETFGGGHGEEMWRGMLVQEYGKSFSQHGGLGLSDSVRSEIIKLQTGKIGGV